ncbi:FG-GAP-like repeat-containing protein [Chitinivorax sp. B]|uniref:FG-GAP-like repeat-containing protein n=1 Tax=Chitinivorax sp. B TaxID=2502235 RepID=UPI001BB1DEE4|nr:FG-GAP-like repeat-containing protein [Chitinivorax sp. B]
MVGLRPYTVSWSSSHATRVTYQCKAGGTGYNDTITLATPNGSAVETASLAWVGHPSTCTWTAYGPGGVRSITDTMTTVANTAPSVTLTHPGQVRSGASILLRATASDPDSNDGVANVYFFVNGTLIGPGTVNGGQYERAWTAPATAGTYTITAQAVDRWGVQGHSTVTLVVEERNPMPDQPVPNGHPAGTLPGQVEVTAAGAASYSIPIAVPPGTAGVVPSISLNYSSQAGDGMIGYGWSLGGLPAITRCPKTRAQDGIGNEQAISLTASDQFCLEGQRLMLVSGTHGATAEYRTELDGFSKILSFGSNPANGPVRWEVWTQSGNRLDLGSTDDSRVEAQGKTAILKWTLAKLSDARSNYYTVAYDKLPAEGEHYPRLITYTGNSNQGVAPYNAIRFHYDTSRSDPQLGYVAGSKVSVLRRLRAIQTHIDTAADGSGGAMVREVWIGYAQNPQTNRSLVTSLTDCHQVGECLPATTFKWTAMGAADQGFNGAGSGVWGGPAVAIPDGANKQAHVSGTVIPADFNGDGKVDLATSRDNGQWQVCLATGDRFDCQTWSGPNTTSRLVLLGDFNGDGRTDLAKPPTVVTRQDPWQLCFSTGSGFSCEHWTGPVSYGDVVVGDFDGDGRTDIVSSTSQVLCQSKGLASVATGFACRPYANTKHLLQAPRMPSGEPSMFQFQPLSQDIDGDGRADLIRFAIIGAVGQYADFSALRADGQGFNTLANARGARGGEDVRYATAGGSWFADHTRDPLQSYPDWLVGFKPIDTVPNTGALQYCSFTGADIRCRDVFKNSDVPDVFNELFADIDGDGRPDGLHWDTARGSWRLCQLSAGAASYSCSDWAGPRAPDFAAHLFGDFNGDGKTDLALYDQPSGSWRVQLAGGPKLDLLREVTNGRGHTTQVSYRPLTDDAVYTPDTTPVAGVRNERNSQQVVSQLQSSNGMGGWFTRSYRYSGLKSDLNGRGSLGFATTQVTDVSSSVVTTTHYRQDYPFIGQAALISERHSNGTELRRDSYDWAERPTATAALSGQSIRFPFVTRHVQTLRELNNGAEIGSLITEVPADGSGYDAFGNLTLQKTQQLARGASHVTLTRNRFDNHPASWQIGLLRESILNKQFGESSITRTTTFDYDGAGQLLRETLEPNEVSLKVVRELGRDGFGNVTRKTLHWTDPVAGSVKTRKEEARQFDSTGRFPHTFTNALQHTETRDYSKLHGALTSLTGPNQLTTRWQYNAWGHTLRESRPDGTATTWTNQRCLDECGDAVSILTTQYWAGQTQIAAPEESHFDALNRLVQARTWGRNGVAIQVQQRYDPRGNLVAVSRPFAAGSSPVWARYEFDDLGRQTKRITPDDQGVLQHDRTDYAGLQTTYTNPKSQTRIEWRNAIGKLDTVIDADGKALQFAYDAFGNLIRTLDAKGNPIQIGYDRLGRKRSLHDPDLGARQYEVDPLGQVYRQTDAKQQVTHFTHDELGRLTRRLQPDQDSRWLYDTAAHGIGKLAEAFTLRGDGGKDYQRIESYDSLSRPLTTRTRLDWDYTATRSYDPAGRLGSISYGRTSHGGSSGPSHTVVYGYTPLGYLEQLTAQRHGADSKVVWRATGTDTANRISQVQLGNGLRSNRTFNQYTGRVMAISSGADNGTSTSNGATVQNDSYGYDVLGNLTRRSHLMWTAGLPYQESFSYDPLNRLQTSQVNVGGTAQPPISYGFDEIGNLSYRSNLGHYRYPASGATAIRPHAVSSIVGTVNGVANPAFSYDDNGNLLSGAGRTLSWTAFNLPSRISDTRHGSRQVSFAYGPEYQRIRQTLTGAAATQPNRVIYAGAMEKETYGHQTLLKTYLPNGIGYLVETLAGSDPAATATGPQQLAYFHRDHLGSVIALSDDSGAVKDQLSYDPWGQRRHLDGSDDPNRTLTGELDRTGYTGHEHLDAVSLIHMNGRVYDPITARFLSPDPTVPDADNQQQYNRYSYVLGNPLSYTDPSGFATVPAETLPDYVEQVMGKRIVSKTDSLADNWTLGCIGISCGNAFANWNLRPAYAGNNVALPRPMPIPRTPSLGLGDLLGKLGSLFSKANLGLALFTWDNNAFKETKCLDGSICSVAQADEGQTAEAAISGEVVAAGSGAPEPDDDKPGRTKHGQQRAEEAKTDSHRSVGDSNRVVREGRKFIDNDTGNTVYVNGDRVVVVNEHGSVVTQFKNTRANTVSRIQSGRWTPVD